MIYIIVNNCPIIQCTIFYQVKINDINDNCPVIDIRDYYILGVPPMTSAPYLKLNPTDADSTINKELAYYRTAPELR